MDHLASMKTGLDSPKLDNFGKHTNSNNMQFNPPPLRLQKMHSIDRILRQNSLTPESQILEAVEDYSWDEKFEWMHQKKLKGSRLFNKKNYPAAIESYREALIGMDFECTTENKARMIAEIQIPCLLNIASCLNQRNENYKGIEFCNRAIDLDQENPLAYLRRGLIYQSLKHYDKAEQDFNTAQSFGADDYVLHTIKESLEKRVSSSPLKSKSPVKEKERYLEQYEDDDNNDEQITIPESPDVLSEEGKHKILKYNDDLEELNRFGALKYVVYPFKMTMKYVSKTICTRRKKETHYEAVHTEQL